MWRSKAVRRHRGGNAMNPVVIAVAITGSVPRKKDNPAVPTTPAEQIESTHEAYEAGAPPAPIHARTPAATPAPPAPPTPAEQLESTHEAYEAGASLVHIHVRNPDESPSSDPALFAQVQEGVGKHCPGKAGQFSTGGGARACPSRAA